MALNTITDDEQTTQNADPLKANFYSPRGMLNNKQGPIAIIEEEVKAEELSKEDKTSVVSHPCNNDSDQKEL